MKTGVFNLVMGLATIVAGLTGEFALIGTGSSFGLVALGVGIAALGAHQVVKSLR